MTGFTYRGLHSIRDIGIVFKTESRPILPPPRILNETVPYRDGSIDYSMQNGRIYYDDKIMELQISIVGRNLKTLHEKISKVVSWLAGGYGELIFDDMPLTVWHAMPVNLNAIAPELAKVGKTVVQFRCKPFNTTIIDSLGVFLGDSVPLGERYFFGLWIRELYYLIRRGEIHYQSITPAPPPQGRNFPFPTQTQTMWPLIIPTRKRELQALVIPVPWKGL